MVHRLKVFIVGVACCSALTPWSDASADGASTHAAIATFHATLIAAMQQTGVDARENLIAGQVQRLFDVEGIARISVGRTWRGLSVDDRDRFKRLLRELIVATYADRFDRFAGQSFEMEADGLDRDDLVRTRLVKVDGSSVGLDYYLRDGRVFNVVADGVSDLSLRRADYRSIVKRQGFNALLGHLETKIALARSGD